MLLLDFFIYNCLQHGILAFYAFLSYSELMVYVSESGLSVIFYLLWNDNFMFSTVFLGNEKNGRVLSRKVKIIFFKYLVGNYFLIFFLNIFSFSQKITKYIVI